MEYLSSTWIGNNWSKGSFNNCVVNLVASWEKLTTKLYKNGGMTSQTLTNWTIRDVVMKTSSRRTSNYFRNNTRDKPSFKKAGKVCFAENLETVHEVPYNYDIYNKSNLRLKLPDIEVHKYTPLVCRDPYARPSKRKLRDKLADMFISDTFKLPLIREDVTKKISPTKSKDIDSLAEPQLPKPKTRTRASDKFEAGNTLHFKYSDFILRKMDRSTSSKEKLFFAK